MLFLGGSRTGTTGDTSNWLSLPGKWLWRLPGYKSTKFVVRGSISTRQKTAVTHAKQDVQCTLPVASFFKYGQHCVIYYTNIIIKTITKELSVELVPGILLLKWTIHGNLEKNILYIHVNNYLHLLVLCSFFISHSWEILSTLRYKMCISTRPCNM